MNNDDFGKKPPSSEEQNRSHNDAHNSILESIHNKDFEHSHGYPHPSTVKKKFNLKEFEKSVADAVKKVFEKKRLP